MPAASLLTAVHRPVPLKARNDLRIVRTMDRGAGSWVVKDPVGLTYHRLQPEQHHVLSRLDGRTSLDDLKQSLIREFPTLTVEPADVQRLVADLATKGLLVSLRAGRSESLLKAADKKFRKKALAFLPSLLYLRVPGWQPDRFLRATLPLVSWVFHPAVVMAGIALIAASLLLVLVQFDEFHRRLPEFQQFFGWPNLLWLWLTLGAIKVIHEFGHAYSCRRFGAECHEIGVMLLVFSPTLYTDASDSWMLRSKWKRIGVAAAGIYVESVLAALCVFVWWNTSPGLLNHLALNTFFVSAVTTTIFNANPLLRYDGYYMLSDYLEVPNLRPKSDGVIRRFIARTCLGLDPPDDPFLPETGRAWLALYGVAAWIYRIVVLFGVSIFLYQVLKPWGLQTIGVMLAGLSVGGMVVQGVMQVADIIKSAGADTMNPTRVTITIAVVAGLLAAALLVPLPLHVESTFQVQPHGQHDVYVVTPGELAEIVAKPGTRVKRGDVLARLVNPEKEDARRKLELQREVEKLNVDVAFAMDDEASEGLAREILAGTESELIDFDRQLAQLTLRAPCDGVVVAPPRTAEPRYDPARTEPLKWHGTPLEDRNVGTWLDRLTHVASIAPDERVDAVLYVDQSDRADLAVGQPVELKFDTLPDRTFEAVVNEISQRDRSTAPSELSQKMGGDLTTVTDKKGQERLASVVYQVTVVLEKETDGLQPGMQGTARFLVDRRSAFDWLWRKVRQTVSFKL